MGELLIDWEKLEGRPVADGSPRQRFRCPICEKVLDRDSTYPVMVSALFHILAHLDKRIDEYMSSRKGRVYDVGIQGFRCPICGEQLNRYDTAPVMVDSLLHILGHLDARIEAYIKNRREKLDGCNAL